MTSASRRPASARFRSARFHPASVSRPANTRTSPWTPPLDDWGRGSEIHNQAELLHRLRRCARRAGAAQRRTALVATKLALGAAYVARSNRRGGQAGLSDLLKRNGFYNADNRARHATRQATQQVQINFDVDPEKAREIRWADGERQRRCSRKRASSIPADGSGFAAGWAGIPSPKRACKTGWTTSAPGIPSTIICWRK